MNKEEFNKLRPGDMVYGKVSNVGYIVTANYGDRVTAVRTVDMTKPDEWTLIQKAAQLHMHGDSAEAEIIIVPQGKHMECPACGQKLAPPSA